MSGRRRVPVNEMLLQEMIAGHVSPAPVNDSPVSVEVKEKNEPPAENDGKIQKEVSRAGRKKQPGYEELYLTPNPVCKNNRQQIYINSDLYERFARFLKVTGGRKISITSYINNILFQHWEANKEVMNELYAQNLNNPL